MAEGPADCLESSDSEPEQEPGTPQKLIRKVSTSGQIRSKTVLKEGDLMKQTSSFQRWKRRYFKLRGRTLYYAQTAKSVIFDEVDLTDASVAESSTKNVNNSFTVITPCRRLILCADNRKEMEEWILALRSVRNRQNYEATQYSVEHFSGMHNWYACSHARPTYCNVCREALSGVTSHGLSCEVCKFKAHKRCAVRATNNCKWTTLASIGKDIIEDEDGVWMPHQWLEGNLPVSAKCSACDKTCGSVLRLQDWRCLWCKAMVHSGCREQLSAKCPLGQCKVSVIPPTALNSIDSDGEDHSPPSRGAVGHSGLTESASVRLLEGVVSSVLHQSPAGLRQLQERRQPGGQVPASLQAAAQPRPGFRPDERRTPPGASSLSKVRYLPHSGVRGGRQRGMGPVRDRCADASQTVPAGGSASGDRQRPGPRPGLGLGLRRRRPAASDSGETGAGQHQDVGQVSPPGGEGRFCTERAAHVRRWSIMVYESKFPRRRSASDCAEDLEVRQILTYEDSVAVHLTEILTSDQHSVVISSAKVLCETVKDFVARVGKAYENNAEPSHQSDVMAKKVSRGRGASRLAWPGLVRSGPASPARPVPDPPPARTQCGLLKEKLDLLLRTLTEESEASSPLAAEEDGGPLAFVLPLLCTAPDPPVFKPREQLMLRANSLKKVIRQIIEHAEKAVDEQNAQTAAVFSPGPADNDDDKTAEGRRSATLGEFRPALRRPPDGRFGILGLFAGNKTNVSSGGGLPLSNSAPLAGSGAPSPSGNVPYPSTGPSGATSPTGASAVDRPLPEAEAFAGREPQITTRYTEKCVMNNYFGIGLDAKISLDFNNKRDEHPEKCRSRTKNMMWYGVLGTKELLHRTYKNLEQRVLLECDGRPIPLPSLQGIAVLNIPSYAGGTNFWGGTKEDDTFAAPSFDDKILEVVAVFGSMQMAVSRVINLQHHRIAQCRTVKIAILGDEGVPVQVDGEAWIQPPGYIKILHKNRSQTLTRDRAFESTLKSWEDKQKCEFSPAWAGQSSHHETVSEEEAAPVREFARAAGLLIGSICQLARSHRGVEQELAHAVNASSKSLDPLYAAGALLSCGTVALAAKDVKALLSETELLLAGKMATVLDAGQQEQLNCALSAVRQRLSALADAPRWNAAFKPADQQEAKAGRSGSSSGGGGGGKFRLVPKFKKDKNNKVKESRGSLALPVQQWGTDEVGAWLDFLCLSEYKDVFGRHDVRGSELLHLERRDLKDLGVSKVGHVKRILQGIRELSRNSSASEA
ncbi:diacylglycerol kinase delta isoform X2 [Stigmatopora argus]